MSRYIDADKLALFIVEHLPRSAPQDAYDAYFDVMRMLKDERATPTADVEEVKHAKWVDENCSNCGTRMPITTVYYRGNLVFKYEGEINYCPNCGAIIDKEKEG